MFMVFSKIRDALDKNDDRYEVLYYKYSAVVAENKKLKDKHRAEMSTQKDDINEQAARNIIGIYQAIEAAKNTSFKVKGQTPEVQNLMLDLNRAEKEVKEVFKKYSIEEVEANKDKFYDPELHDVASYTDAKGMRPGLIVKTAKKGFKYRTRTIIRPKVVVAK